jgi:hypothetical protein
MREKYKKMASSMKELRSDKSNMFLNHRKDDFPKKHSFKGNLIDIDIDKPRSLTPPLLPRKPVALMQRSASAPEITFSGYSFERNRVLIDAEEYFDSVRKNV